MANYVEDVPEELRGNLDAICAYLSMLERFDRQNEMAPKGVYGSYCRGGQRFVAFNFAMSFIRPLKMRECHSLEEAGLR